MVVETKKQKSVKIGAYLNPVGLSSRPIFQLKGEGM
jgi:hypothetical protein